MKPQLEYVGHIITENGIKPNPNKLDKVRDYPAPRNLKGLKRFMRMIGFYRKFKENFGKIIAPLNILTRKHIKFRFDEKCIQAFNILKRELCSERILAYPDLNK